MPYSDSLHELMQNGLNGSFWDAHGVKIEAWAFFEHFARSDKICPEGNFFVDWMLWDFGAIFLARPNLDSMSVPEAVVHSIRILVAPAVFLAHPWLKS